jgi:predicted exporter/lauroyl/myristoyl acyltransferase
VGLGFYRLRFDVDILNLLPPDEPTVQGLKLYQQHFTNAREFLISVRGKDPEQAERLSRELAERLRQHTNLVATVHWRAPWMEKPEQLAELLACAWINQPPEVFGALTNRLAPSQLPDLLANTKETLATSMSPMDVARLAFDPFDLLSLPGLTNLNGMSMEQGQQMFASSGGDFRLVFVYAAMDLTSYRACERWLEDIHRVIDGVRASSPADWEGARLRYTGRPVFVIEIAHGMQKDMSGSVTGTSIIIAFLFWLTHRRWLPMVWLLVLLGVILIATLALGALVLGSISVVSMGFAAVLLGLAVDYAVVHYQEALAHPQLSVPEIRRAIAPSILWAAITTVSAFLVLNLGGLPGLAQLGTLVAIGVAVAALVMVMVYLPPLFPGRRQAPLGVPVPRVWHYFIPPRAVDCVLPTAGVPQRGPLGTTAIVLMAAVLVLCFRFPGVDRSGDALKPANSEAEAALAEITREMGLPPEPLWLVVTGKDEPQVYSRLMSAEALLNVASTNKVVDGFLLPSMLWPRAEYQASNRITAAYLGTQGPILRDAAFAAGFNTNALILADELVKTWARAGRSEGVTWPTNYVSQWLLKRFVAQAPGQWMVMGMVRPATNSVDADALSTLSRRLAEEGALLSGWNLLGSATLARVKERLWLLVAPMVLLVLVSLWFAFRRATEILLGTAVMIVSGMFLLAVMGIFGWSWNLLNLMSFPLILGTGVDYSIFMQMGLRRHGGDAVVVRRSIGRALLLCGGTAVAGFGSLAWSSNPGMASLGKVCAVGIGANMLIAVFLLPSWWLALVGGKSRGQAPSVRPPSMYRAGLWWAGLALVRVLPAGLLKACFRGVAEIYMKLRPERVELVTKNLLPVLGGERLVAERKAKQVHRFFSAKLVDLWRVESGIPVTDWITTEGELDIIKTASKRGRGVLFITLHLGNWEHGGLLLSQLGMPLTVLTLAEPDDGLTALRVTLRRRCGVETLMIGQDSFAFIEVIKKLQTGAALAISLDRPPPRGGVPIQFFGEHFLASSAAADLARASGCALVGVTLTRRPNGYAVKVLPEFSYDRQALGNREARAQLTEEILRAFAPLIRQDIEQWYQFVPLWSQDNRVG